VPLLSIKIYDENDEELYSTISINKDEKLNNFIPFFRSLLENNRQLLGLEQTLAVIIDECLIAFNKTEDDLLLVAISTINSSFRKLEHLLELLCKALCENISRGYSNTSKEKFQEICDDIIATIDSYPRLNIALLGLGRSGKTTFIKYFEENTPLAGFEEYEPTDVLNIIDVERIDEFPYAFKFIDLGINFQNHWYEFKNEADAFIFFVDTADAQEMNKSRDLLQELVNFWDMPYVIAANKRDISKIVNIRKYLARKFRVPIRKIFETETMTGTGLIPMLEGLIKKEMSLKKMAVSIRSQKKER
jgi:GTPase SAR1 family protein